jgi:hypothetical protein
MTKAAIVASTVLVWTAAFAATGALTYVVRQPLAPAARVTETLPPPARLDAAPIAAVPESPIFVLPTVEIVGTLPHAVKPTPKPARDISEMHCSPWRPLAQGAGGVQVCD